MINYEIPDEEEELYKKFLDAKNNETLENEKEDNDEESDDENNEDNDINDDDVQSIMSETSRASAKRSARKSSIVTKKNVKVVEPVKCIETKNSVNEINRKVEKFYKKKINKENSETIDIGKDIPLSENEKLCAIIKLFLVVDEKCKALNDVLKDLKDERKQYEDHILNFMGEYEKEKIPYDKTVLKREIKEVKPKPREEDIVSTLSLILKDKDVAYDITRKIFDSMQSEEKISLKKENEKKPPKVPKKNKNN